MLAQIVTVQQIEQKRTFCLALIHDKPFDILCSDESCDFVATFL